MDSAEDLLDLPRNLKTDSVNLLMAEYEHLAESLLANEEMGERRVNIFIGVIAGVMAAVGFAAQEQIFDFSSTKAAGGASLALLVFGLVTLRRIMQRNLTSTDYMNGLRRIRAYFARQEPKLARVLPFVPSLKPIPRDHHWLVGKGGHLEQVTAVNSLLALLTVVVFVWPMTIEWDWTIAVLVGSVALAWFSQKFWARQVYAKQQEKLDGRRTEALRWWAQMEEGE